MDTNLLIAIATIVGGFIGYFLQSWLDRKKEINSENAKVKREIYKKYVSMIIDLIGGSKTNQAVGKISNLEEKLYEFYKDFVLYSSPGVINALGNYMQYLYEHPESMEAKIIFRKLTKVVSEMRKELGLSNLWLGKDGINIFRAMFKDFDKIK